MRFKLINLKACLALIGIVLLMGAILHGKKPPAATSQSRFTTPELTYAEINPPHRATNGGFLDDINLSLDSPMKIHDPDFNRASLNLQRDLPPGSFDRLQHRRGDATKPAFTVAGRKLNYELFGSENFALKLNFEPAYPNREAAIPTGLDPGFGISLKF
jgi:hypothetical protein